LGKARAIGASVIRRGEAGFALSYEADVSARCEREREAEMATERHLHPEPAVHSPGPPGEDSQLVYWINENITLDLARAVEP
jgi:hypothetical protein